MPSLALVVLHEGPLAVGEDRRMVDSLAGPRCRPSVVCVAAEAPYSGALSRSTPEAGGSRPHDHPHPGSPAGLRNTVQPREAGQTWTGQAVR